MSDEGAGTVEIAARIRERLAPALGPINARVWVKVLAEKTFRKTPEELTAADVRPLLDGLRQALTTIMGGRAADDLLRAIEREVG